MLTVLCASLAALRVGPTTSWYGPATATFAVQFSGNPFDPGENDVHVRFTDKKKKSVDRLAYFNETLGTWQADLCAPAPGVYTAQLVRNGQDVPGANKEGPQKIDHALPHGYIHPDPKHLNRFIWDDGTPEVPIGFDLAWQNGGDISIPQQLAKMGASGVDWTRIWACSWDGKNPWWPSDHQKVAPEQLWAPALDKWDQIEKAAEQDKVGIQFVLFHHGEFSSQVDPNWPDNPWNVKNGGFLAKPGDFFTDPEAKKRAKIWLRYAVARYGASPAIFGWELFNEVQWVDPIHISHRWDEVEAWHKEMADYVRSIDPYHHPVTSSSELRPNFNSSLDYVQPHTYPNNILSSVMGQEMPKDKPGFFGEFGPGNMRGVNLHLATRDGLLGGLIANQAGGGMLWYWDSVEHQNLYSEFAIGRKVADLSGWGRHPGATVSSLQVETPSKSTFVFQPGGGWGPSTQTSFDLPAGATPTAIGHLSSYLQGNSHRDMMAGPVDLKFSVSVPSSIKVELNQISDGGGSLAIKIDGSQVYEHAFVKGNPLPPIEFPLAAGAHEVQMVNNGPDWVGLNKVSISNLASGASAVGLGEKGWTLARLTRRDGGTAPILVGLSGLSLLDGEYEMTEINLDSGLVKTLKAQIKDSKTSITVSDPDEVLILKRSK